MITLFLTATVPNLNPLGVTVTLHVVESVGLLALAQITLVTGLAFIFLASFAEGIACSDKTAQLTEKNIFTIMPGNLISVMLGTSIVLCAVATFLFYIAGLKVGGPAEIAHPGFQFVMICFLTGILLTVWLPIMNVSFRFGFRVGKLFQ